MHVEVFVPITLFIAIVVVVIYLRRYQHIERLAMIEKGVDASLFTKKITYVSGALRASLLLIGSGVGLLLGYVLDRAYRMEEVGYFSMLLILGGLGLGTAYVIEERKRRKEAGVSES